MKCWYPCVGRSEPLWEEEPQPIKPLHLHVSTHNRKIGKVLNVSTLPGVTCRPDAPCLSICYAYRLSTWVYASWLENTTIALEHPDQYEREIMQALTEHDDWPRKLFRYDIGGDCPNQGILEIRKRIARESPRWKFLMYTKADFLDYAEVPYNLQVRFSKWPGFKVGLTWLFQYVGLPHYMQTRVCGYPLRCI